MGGLAVLFLLWLGGTLWNLVEKGITKIAEAKDGKPKTMEEIMYLPVEVVKEEYDRWSRQLVEEYKELVGCPALEYPEFEVEDYTNTRARVSYKNVFCNNMLYRVNYTDEQEKRVRDKFREAVVAGRADGNTDPEVGYIEELNAWKKIGVNLQSPWSNKDAIEKLREKHGLPSDREIFEYTLVKYGYATNPYRTPEKNYYSLWDIIKPCANRAISSRGYYPDGKDYKREAELKENADNLREKYYDINLG